MPAQFNLVPALASPAAPIRCSVDDLRLVVKEKTGSWLSPAEAFWRF